MNNFNKFAFDLSNAKGLAQLKVNGKPYVVKVDSLTQDGDDIRFEGGVIDTNINYHKFVWETDDIFKKYCQDTMEFASQIRNSIRTTGNSSPYTPRDLRTLIDKVIFNNPATIIIWKDGSKTVVKCQEGETFDEEKGLAMAISKRALGDKGNFNEVFKEYVKNEPEKKEEPAKTAFENVADALYSTLTKPYFSIDKMATAMAQLEKVSGMSIEELTRMFARGMVLCDKDYIDQLVSMTNPKEKKK